MINRRRKNILTFVVFVVVMTLFVLVASFEYARTVDNQKEAVQDRLVLVQKNLENTIISRMISMLNLSSYIEINGELTQEEYAVFSKPIYESNNQVVNSMTFITDTTITHIYPFDGNESAIGIDLAAVPEQKDLIVYAKEQVKEVFTAPVNLVEGGVGIVVRAPVMQNNSYYGQIAIIFNYDKTLESSGIKEMSDDFYLEITSINPLDGQVHDFWKNHDEAVEDMIEHKVNIYESELTIRVKPLVGWKGTSVLFHLIIVLGFAVSSVSAFGVNKVLSINETLEATNKELQESILQVVESENKLKKQFDQIKRQEQYIKFLADHDTLTGLSNRRQFIEAMENELLNNRHGAMVLLDLDNFKNINDTMGHVYGDKILIYISGMIEDTLGEDASVYRLGGDEFIILIKDSTKRDAIDTLINRVVDKLAEGIELNETINHISASFGVSIYPEDGITVEELMVKADIAMYSAKNSGKNLTKYFVENMVSVFEYRVQIEKRLHQAIESDGFEVYYQPIVKAETGDIVSFEALLRMKDKSMGPAEFIPVAEETGLIVTIGRWVLHTVVEQLVQWKEKGINIKPIAINLSPKQINDASLMGTLNSIFESGMISPEMIEIEITENVLIENHTDNIKILKNIKEMGIKLSLDDFGTGYSSLNYLTFMPVEQVKLDKSLKDKFINNPEHGIMDGLISIAHGLGLDVVVEGVETSDEFKRLSSHSIDYMQGYLFSKPIPADAVESMLMNGNFKITPNVQAK